MATRNYEANKFSSAFTSKIVDALTVEEALQINVNDAPFTVSMRTPGDDISFVRGLLHSEDVISDISFNPEISIKKENKDGIVTVVNIAIPKGELGLGYSNSRSLLSVSSCGVCGKTELKDLDFQHKTIEDSNKISIELIHQLV